MNINQGLDTTISIKEIGMIRKNISGIIDAAIILFVFVRTALIFPLDTLSYLEGPLTPGIYIYLLLALYRLISFLIFNRTIGMWICSVQILNDNLESPSVKEKIFASFFILINGVSFYRILHL